MDSPVRFINIKEACRRTCLGKTTLLNWEAVGKFPRAVRLSASKRVWYEGDIVEWIMAKRNQLVQVGLEAYDVE